ncbi:MAG: methyl-accepting chemotaxis protein, partial [Bdellovibrionales bacterium]
SLDEVTSMIIKNSENAQRASEISLKTRSAAEAGETKINELQTAMSEISSSSKKMVEIINVIDEIAFQTNLLALNAAVEAARAGEQGRGFAVVADAVRTLAQRSAEAARSINQMIDESVNKINLGSGIVESFKSELNSIFSSVKSVSELNHEIAQASNEQRVGIEQISQAMNEIEQITQRNSANTNQLASVIEVVGDELRNLNLNISDLKNQFVNSGKIEKKDHSVQAHVIKFPIREVDSFFKVSGLEGIQNKAQIKKIGEF